MAGAGRRRRGRPGGGVLPRAAARRRLRVDELPWFGERYEDFVYLDRVAVDAASQGRGVGAALYAEVERQADATWFTLEVNLRPRNDGSLRFHDRLGFVEVGQQETNYGALVSLMAKRLR